MYTESGQLRYPIASSHKNVLLWIIILMALFVGLVLCNGLCALLLNNCAPSFVGGGGEGSSGATTSKGKEERPQQSEEIAASESDKSETCWC